MRLENPVIAEDLWRLDLHQVGAFDGAVNEAGTVHVLVGVADRDRRGRRPMLAGSLQPRMDQVVANQRPGAVVHNHEIRRIL